MMTNLLVAASNLFSGRQGCFWACTCARTCNQCVRAAGRAVWAWGSDCWAPPCSLILRLVWMSLLVYIAASAMTVMMGVGEGMDPLHRPGDGLRFGHLHLTGRGSEPWWSLTSFRRYSSWEVPFWWWSSSPFLDGWFRVVPHQLATQLGHPTVLQPGSASEGDDCGWHSDRLSSGTSALPAATRSAVQRFMATEDVRADTARSYLTKNLCVRLRQRRSGCWWASLSWVTLPKTPRRCPPVWSLTTDMETSSFPFLLPIICPPVSRAWWWPPCLPLRCPVSTPVSIRSRPSS